MTGAAQVPNRMRMEVNDDAHFATATTTTIATATATASTSTDSTGWKTAARSRASDGAGLRLGFRLPDGCAWGLSGPRRSKRGG
ncbi:hypothetical protein IAQ61_006633 [Plenodomus lingam]|uniref:uncharacterized protein n=1 Tax=Leptosphaeria maculans TaxID=5022 RepID=UPI003321A877|nr:hypothetical protein IAQ61_006633 [Plenodomus lingam]